MQLVHCSIQWCDDFESLDHKIWHQNHCKSQGKMSSSQDAAKTNNKCPITSNSLYSLAPNVPHSWPVDRVHQKGLVCSLFFASYTVSLDSFWLPLLACFAVFSFCSLWLLHKCRNTYYTEFVCVCVCHVIELLFNVVAMFQFQLACHAHRPVRTYTVQLETLAAAIRLTTNWKAFSVWLSWLGTSLCCCIQ